MRTQKTTDATRRPTPVAAQHIWQWAVIRPPQGSPDPRDRLLSGDLITANVAPLDLAALLASSKLLIRALPAPIPANISARGQVHRGTRRGSPRSPQSPAIPRCPSQPV